LTRELIVEAFIQSPTEVFHRWGQVQTSPTSKGASTHRPNKPLSWERNAKKFVYISHDIDRLVDEHVIRAKSHIRSAGEIKLKEQHIASPPEECSGVVRWHVGPDKAIQSAPGVIRNELSAPIGGIVRQKKLQVPNSVVDTKRS
jgi:hypothetical protein